MRWRGCKKKSRRYRERMSRSSRGTGRGG